jgi:hypothetical protein
MTYLGIERILSELSNKLGCSDPFLWSESMYLTIYESVSNGHVDKLLDLKSEIHSKHTGNLFCMKVDGEFDNAERGVQEIIHADSKILSDNYTIGAIMVVPKNRGSGIIIYLSKE